MMIAIRWWFFKRLSEIGWRICPEPHRSRLQARLNLNWDQYEP